MSSFEWYLILKLDTVRTCLALMIVLSISIILWWISIYDKIKREKNEKVTEKESRFLKTTTLIFLVSLVFYIILPSTKQALIITFGPKIMNNHLIQTSPNKIDKILDLYIEKLQNEVKK